MVMSCHTELEAWALQRVKKYHIGEVRSPFDLSENYVRSAAYVARILKGEKPADLPMQFSTKLVLAINLTAAKALGVDVPPVAARSRRRGDRMIRRREFITLVGGQQRSKA